MNWVGEPDFEALVKLNMSGDVEQRAAVYAVERPSMPLLKRTLRRAAVFSEVTPDGSKTVSSSLRIRPC